MSRTHAPTPGGAPERVAVIGLGFVGLQVAVAFGKVRPTLGFDIDASRVEGLRKGHDRNGEVTREELSLPTLEFTTEPRELAACDVFIVAVPTPVDDAHRPDLGALVAASRTAGEAMKARAAAGRRGTPLVVYESSTYPGCTEEDCVPVLEKVSGLKAGQGFQVGYSPERINPGDPEHRFEAITKVVSGQDAATLDRVAALYGSVVKAGVYKAPDIRTAEAAKVIENTQRDLNIALMNELATLFHRMGIDTQEVLKASETKWNFLRFRPGLVGGHCIPVDPYYLTHKAEQLGHFPEVILAGRRINDQMGRWVAQQVVRLHLQRGGQAGARALVLGVAFKEDVPDARDTRVVDLVRELQEHGLDVRVHDPLLGPERLERMGLPALERDPFAGGDGATWDIVVLAVPHKAYKTHGPEGILRLLPRGARRGVFADVKAALPAAPFAKEGVARWAL